MTEVLDHEEGPDNELVVGIERMNDRVLVSFAHWSRHILP